MNKSDFQAVKQLHGHSRRDCAELALEAIEKKKHGALDVIAQHVAYHAFGKDKPSPDWERLLNALRGGDLLYTQYVAERDVGKRAALKEELDKRKVGVKDIGLAALDGVKSAFELGSPKFSLQNMAAPALTFAQAPSEEPKADAGGVDEDAVAQIVSAVLAGMKK